MVVTAGFTDFANVSKDTTSTNAAAWIEYRATER
jgi:hypothetical protein